MENSVMWPYYKNAPTKGYTLPEFDVQNIQSIYGKFVHSFVYKSNAYQPVPKNDTNSVFS